MDEKCDFFIICVGVLSEIEISTKNPDCVRIPETAASINQMNRKIRKDVREIGNRPRDVYEQVRSSIAVQYPNCD